MTAADSHIRSASLRVICWAFLCGTLSLMLGGVPAAHANAIVVTSKLDATGGPGCTLHDAITAANTHAATGGCPAGQSGLDTITFGFVQCNVVPCSITLNNPLPAVSEDLDINGAVGGVLVTINGNHAVRIFELGPVAVQLSNLRIQFGSAGSGAAIQMSSTNPGTNLAVSNVFFVGNQATSNGGAIDQPLGALSVVNSRFDANSAQGNGGAINHRDGLFSVSHSSFISNTATIGGAGGAIFTAGTGGVDIGDSLFDANVGSSSAGAMMIQSSANVSRSTFSNNRSLGTQFNFGGGALAVTANSMTTTIGVSISQSTLVDNFSARNGGGMSICDGQVRLTNLTLSGNTANGPGGGIGVRSGFCPGAPVVDIRLNNLTISNNTADSDGDTVGDGGGMFRGAGTVTLQNSLIAGNFDTPGNAGPGTIHPDCSGTFASGGFTLIGKNDGCSGLVNGTNGDIVGTAVNPISALLGVLADNGGPTLTHALLTGSPAINAGNPLAPGSGGFACAATDQRGVLRPLGPQCDMGAFEAGAPVFLPLIGR